MVHTTSPDLECPSPPLALICAPALLTLTDEDPSAPTWGARRHRHRVRSSAGLHGGVGPPWVDAGRSRLRHGPAVGADHGVPRRPLHGMDGAAAGPGRGHGVRHDQEAPPGWCNPDIDQGPLQVCAIRTLTRGWDQGLDLAIIICRYAGEKHEPSPGLVGTCVDLCALRRSCLTACARAH